MKFSLSPKISKTSFLFILVSASEIIALYEEYL